MNEVKVGAFLSAKRKEKGWTQADLASRLHLSDRTISKWERGKGLPDVAILPDLAKELGITVDELICGESSPIHRNIVGEEEALDILRSQQGLRKKMKWVLEFGIAGLLVDFGLLFFARIYPSLNDVTRFVLLGFALACMLFHIPVLCLVDIASSPFICSCCGKEFTPKIGTYVFGPHTWNRRFLCCPHCGRRSLCKKK